MDTREKLEADVYQAADELDRFYCGEKFIDTRKIIGWLDRQAAITKRGCHAITEPYEDAAAKTIGDLRAALEATTKDRDRLREQLEEYDGDCYRGATSVQWYEHSVRLQAKVNELQAVLEAKEQLERDSAYMRLPVDVDGVPIRIGDTMERVCAEVPGTFIVGLIGADGHCMDDETSFFIASECRHVKPDTIEGIIAEAMSFACEPESPYSKNSKYVKQYAERIRKAMEE